MREALLIAGKAPAFNGMADVFNSLSAITSYWVSCIRRHKRPAIIIDTPPVTSIMML